jgi:hypothetical protein
VGQTAYLSEEAESFAAAQAEADRQVRAIVERAARRGQRLRLSHPADGYGLDVFDLDASLICLAPTLDLRYERLYGCLQDDVSRRPASVNLVLDLLCEVGPKQLRQLARFSETAPLFAEGLLERVPEPARARASLLGQGLTPDKAIKALFLADYRPHADLGGQDTDKIKG